MKCQVLERSYGDLEKNWKNKENMESLTSEIWQLIDGVNIFQFVVTNRKPSERL